MANVKNIIASLRDARISTRVFASADVTADEMGNTWVNVNLRNAHGMTTRACMSLDVDGTEDEPATSMYRVIRHGIHKVLDDDMSTVLHEYTLEDIVTRVDERGGIYAANAANNLANKLCNEVVRVMAEAIDSGNALVNNAVRAGAMRGAFAALI